MNITARSTPTGRPQFRGPADSRIERCDLRVIALAVIAQTREELALEGTVLGAEARAFLDDEDFDTWCEIAGLAPGRVRRALLGHPVPHVLEDVDCE